MTDDGFNHLPREWAQVCRLLDEALSLFQDYMPAHESRERKVIAWTGEVGEALAAARQHRPGDMETAREIAWNIQREVQQCDQVNFADPLKTWREIITRHFAAALAAREAEVLEKKKKLGQINMRIRAVNSLNGLRGELSDNGTGSVDIDKGIVMCIARIRALNADGTAPGTAKPGA